MGLLVFDSMELMHTIQGNSDMNDLIYYLSFPKSRRGGVALSLSSSLRLSDFVRCLFSVYQDVPQNLEIADGSLSYAGKEASC